MDDNPNLLSVLAYEFADESHIKIEKSKVKAAKKSRWWQQKTSKGICHYCARKFAFKDLTLDHIVPLARGGTTSPGNVVPACRECNKNKGVDTHLDIAISVINQ